MTSITRPMSAIHFCIDVQVAYKRRFPPDKWSALKTNITRLATALEAHQVPTVYIAFSFKRSFSTILNGIHEIQHLPTAMREHYEARPLMAVDFPLSKTSLIGFKNRNSVFQEKPIIDYVEQRGISTVILSGIYETSEPITKPLYDGNCVSMTAHHFRSYGYQAIIAAECTNGIFSTDDYIAETRLDEGRLYAKSLTRKKELSSLTYRKKIHAKLGVHVEPMEQLFKRLKNHAT